MSNLFAKLGYEAFRAGINPRTKEAQDWFRRKAQQMRRVNRTALMNSEEVKLVNRQQPLIGSRVSELLFEPLDAFTIDAIREEIEITIKQLEKRVRLNKVDIIPIYENNKITSEKRVPLMECSTI